MTAKWRLGVFLAFGPAFLAAYLAAALGLPAWGHYRGPYGDVIAGLAVYQRHATDVVNAITYDYRGFDTLGEEFILFTSVLGVMMILRDPNQASGLAEADQGLSETVRIASLFGCAIIFLFGLYITCHGQISPGGGFQGGVLIATAPMLIYIAYDLGTFKRISSHPLVESLEALGAGLYAIVGLSACVLGLPFLTNWLPLGTTGDVFSSGTIAVISACVGLEVAASFVLLSYTYLQDILTGRSESE